MMHYAPENASFLLPMQFDPQALQADLAKCQSYAFAPNYIPQNYDGKDYILPLRSIEGRMDLLVAVPNQPNRYDNTEALNSCTYFQEVIHTFLCDKEAIRLMNLPPGKQLNTHTDYNCGYEDGIFRVHVPITTNNEVYFILNEKRIVMQPGEAWYTNVNLPHSVANKGTTNRVHLVMDCIRNAWSDELFGSLGYDFSQEKEVPEPMDPNTIQSVIRELELQDATANAVVIQTLKEQLK